MRSQLRRQPQCTITNTRRRQMKKVFATLFALVLMVSSAYAHNGMEHVMGTVASITDNSITVTTTDGKSQTVTTTADTKYTKMDAAIALKGHQGRRPCRDRCIKEERQTNCCNGSG